MGLHWNHISDSGLYENYIIIYVILPLKKTAQHFTGGNPAMQAVLLIMRKLHWNHISDSGLYENYIIIYVILPLKKTAQHFTGGNPAMQAVLLIMRKVD